MTRGDRAARTEAPERAVSARIAAIAVPFLGGPLIGSTLADWLVPDSAVAVALSFFVLPLAMVAGFYGWIGLALVTLLGRLARRVLRGKAREAAVAGGVPPGSFVFVPTAAAAMGIAGIACGLLPSSTGFFRVTLAYAACGAAYGALLHALARAGYLQFPDEL